jgi:prepilin signal peptidase PulO-like enzyme (type II secretory pathway)
MLTRYFCIGLLLSLLAGVAFGSIAGGVCVSILFGFMAGNFACSLVYRLPRNKSLLEHTPYCGVCAHPLSELDLLPVIGVLLLKHKCRYCGAPIPVSHIWTELALGALFALYFLRFGFSQDYVLCTLLATSLVTLAAIALNEGRVMTSLLVAAMVAGAVFRTLHDGEIYNFLQGGLYGLLLGLAIWHRQVKRVRHIYSLPDGAKLTAMTGIISGAFGVWPVVVVASTLYAAWWTAARLLKRRALPFAVAIAVAIAVSLLVPKLSPEALIMLTRMH